MAKTGGNFERCNVGSVEAHNERTPEYLQSVRESGRNLYFFQDLTKNNTSFVNPTYEGKTCSQIFQDLVQLYKSKIGQMPQLKDKEWIDKKTGKKKKRPGWSPIREAVIPIKADTTLEDFDKLIAWLREKGVEVIRLDLHKDEGYENLVGKRKMNYHAHLVVDWIDHKTANTAKLTPADMREFQTMCALSLDMERGTPKTVTGKEHLNSAEYREKAAERHLAEMTGIGAKMAAFFGVGELAEIRKELKETKEERDVAIEDKAATEKALKETKEAEKAAKEALQEAKKAHAEELQAEKEKSRQKGISDAKKIAELQMEVKSMKSKPDPLTEVNAVLTHLSMPRLTAENMKELQATATASPFRAMSPWLRPNLCNAIMVWAYQRKRVTNGYHSPADLTLLKEMWWAMKEAWQEVCSALKEVVMSSAEIFLTTTWKGVRPTHQAALADVESVLRFTPGPSVEGWQEAVNMTEEQYDKQLQEYVQPIEQAATSLDVEQEEEHIEEEQTRQQGWHR